VAQTAVDQAADVRAATREGTRARDHGADTEPRVMDALGWAGSERAEAAYAGPTSHVHAPRPTAELSAQTSNGCARAAGRGGAGTLCRRYERRLDRTHASTGWRLPCRRRAAML